MSTIPEVRPCDELILTLTPTDVRRLMKMHKDLLLDQNFPYQEEIENWIDRKWMYGMKAYKICSSCADLRETYSSEASFDSYCGEGKYGADVNVSGLLTIPIDEDGEFIKMKSNIALWNRWLEWEATECPTEQLPNSSDWGDLTEEFDDRGFVSTSLFTTGVGVVPLLPDYIGFCESFQLFGAPAIKSAYQAGIVPLVLKARDFFVEEITAGKPKLSNYVGSSGYSEGAVSAIAAGDALHELGFRVRIQTVSCCHKNEILPFQHISIKI